MKAYLLLFSIICSLFFSSPGEASDLLVTSLRSVNVLRFDGRTGDFVEVFIPTGLGGLAAPDGIAFGNDGNVAVQDFNLNQLLLFNGETGDFIRTLGPSGMGGEGVILGPDGNFYVAGLDSDQVLKITPQGSSSAFASGMDGPEDMVFGPDGNLYVTACFGNDVRRFDGATGQLIDVFVVAGLGGLSCPVGISFGPDGNLYVASGDTASVIRYNGSDGGLIGDFIPAGVGGLVFPYDLFFRSDGNLYVANPDNHEILRYDGTTGAFIDAFVSAGDGGLDEPLFMAFFPAGEMEFSADAFTVDENAGNASVQINRNNGSNGEVTVQFATSNGTATAGTDYSDASQAVTFADGETSKTISIPVLDNGTAEGDKTVNLALSDPTDDATLGAISTAVLTITDNDAEGGGCWLGAGSASLNSLIAWVVAILSPGMLRILRRKP